MKKIVFLSSLLLACSGSVNQDGGGGGDGGASSNATTSSANPTGPTVSCEAHCARLDDCDFVDDYAECMHECELVDPDCVAETEAVRACYYELFEDCTLPSDPYACSAQSDALGACELELPPCSTSNCTNPGTDDCSCNGQCGEHVVQQICGVEVGNGGVGAGPPEGQTMCECIINGEPAGACSQFASECSIEGGCCKYNVLNFE